MGLPLPFRATLVEDSSNVIKSYTEDDSLVAPPGHTAVNVSVIEAAYTGTIYQGGTWDGTTYTPPTGIVTPIDGATDQGAVQLAAHNMMDVFDEAFSFIRGYQHVWTQDAITRAIDGMYWMSVNAARVALNDTRTHANRQKFLEEAASWPTGVNGDPRQYVDAVGEANTFMPSKDTSWVNPETTPPSRYPLSMAAGGFNSATNVEDAPTSDKLLGRSWINDIP